MARRDDWTTPQKLFDWLDGRFQFNIDAAANKKNAKCSKFFSAKNSFLTNHSVVSTDTIDLDLGARIFCNPPYSLDREFAEVCYGLYQEFDIPSVLLLPVRSDRIWYNKLLNAKGVRSEPYTGRIHFGGSGKGAFMYNINVIIGFWDVKKTYKYIDAGQFNEGGKGSAKT